MSARIKPHRLRRRELEEIREKHPEARIMFHRRTVDMRPSEKRCKGLIG